MPSIFAFCPLFLFRHLQQRKELQERLGEAEAEVVKKVEENRELREIIRSKDEKLLAMSQMECSISKEDDSEKLKSQMEELTELFVQEEEARKYLEEALQCKEFEYSELRNILAVSIPIFSCFFFFF